MYLKKIKQVLKKYKMMQLLQMLKKQKKLAKQEQIAVQLEMLKKQKKLAKQEQIAVQLEMLKKHKKLAKQEQIAVLRQNHRIEKNQHLLEGLLEEEGELQKFNRELTQLQTKKQGLLTKKLHRKHYQPTQTALTIIN